MKHSNTNSDVESVFDLAEKAGLKVERPPSRRTAPIAETTTTTVTASTSQSTPAMPGQTVVPNVPVDFRQPAAPLPLEPIQDPHVLPPPVLPSERTPRDAGKKDGTSGDTTVKLDKESREVLRYISEDFVFLSGKSPCAYHIASGDEMGRESFQPFCAKHYGDVVFVDKEGKETRVNAGTVWWSRDDQHRRVVRRIVMEPTEKSEVDDDPEVFNRWHVLKHTMVEPNTNATMDDIQILYDHLLYLADGDEVAVRYFLNWLAWLWQHPGTKIPVAILLYSQFGRVGKSSLHKLISRVFGPTMVASCSGAAISKNFDDIVEHKRIIVINEMGSTDKKDGYEKFKNMISEPTVAFEGKGRAAKEVENIAHYIVTTNNLDCLPLMQNDGRIAVLMCTSERKSDAYYAKLVPWMENDGPALLAGVLAQWQFPKGWDPYAPAPQTEAARTMQLESRPAHEIALMALVEEGQAPFDKDLGKLSDLCRQLQTLYGDNLLGGFKINHKTLPRALTNVGVKKVGSGTASNDQAYCWRNYDFWFRVPLAQMKEYRDGGPNAPRPAPTAIPHGEALQ